VEHEQLVIGVDAGGSHTRVLIASAEGGRVAFAGAGGGNPTSCGLGATVRSLMSGLEAALLGMDGRAIGYAVLGVAGAGPCMAELQAAVRDVWRATGLRCPFQVVSDLEAAFAAGTPAEDGVVLVSGTGAAAAAIRGARVVRFVDGNGWLLGDDGSGFWIGHHVVRAVVADLDGRGPPTGLTPLVLARLGIDNTHESRSSFLSRLTEIVYGMRPVQLAQFAPVAFTVGDDAAAVAIVDGASQALARTLGTVLDEGIDGPLVLGGSVLLHQASVAVAVETSFRRQGGAGHVVKVPDGVAGAAALALRNHGVTVDGAVFARIDASLAALRNL
jgi:glucosamine kinase